MDSRTRRRGGPGVRVKFPPLHVVATEDAVGRSGFDRTAADLLNAGGPEFALHLRIRSMDAGDLFRLAERLSAVAEDAGGWCVVNDRPDIALTAGSQAVQLGYGALTVPAARRLLGVGTAIGASVHSPDEAGERAGDGADYLVAGTVFQSASHPGLPAAGLGLIRSCAGLAVPVVAIGGIDAANAAAVMEAGAEGVAVIRAVWNQPEPVQAAMRLLEAVRGRSDGAASEGGVLGSRRDE